MNKISVTFSKNKYNKYTFEVKQNGKNLYKKDYVADKTYTDTDMVPNQAVAFHGFVDYIQDRVNFELKRDPEFKFDDLEQFKKFAGAKLQKEFYTVQEKYFEKYREQLK